MKFKDLWHPVETGNPDMMGFRHGGARPQLFAGCCFVLVGVVMMGFLLSYSANIWSWIVAALEMNEYSLAAGLYLLMGLFALSATKNVILGIWFIFGRIDLQLERRNKTMTKSYRIRSFCLYRKKFDLGASSFFIFRRSIRSFAPMHFLRLKDASEKRRYVLALARGVADDGWRMAELMAGFFGIPLREEGLRAAK